MYLAEADPLMQTQPLEVPPALQTRKPPNSAARPISAPQFRDEEAAMSFQFDVLLKNVENESMDTERSEHENII